MKPFMTFIRERVGVPTAILITMIAIAGIVWVGKQTVSVEGSVQLAETYTVREGPLTISVTEAGTIQAREQIVLKCEVEGQTQIISLIPEGTRVSKGDLLVELDSSALVDRRVDQEIQVQNAEAAYISSQENLKVVKNQAESDIAAAKLTLQFAREDLTKYLEGDYPMELKRAEADIALAESEQSMSTEQLNGSKRLYDEGYLTSIEFDRDSQLKEKADLELELSRASLDLLQEYTYERKLTELNSAIEEAERALERAELKASADIVQAEAQFRANESEFNRQQDKLAKLEVQIEKTKIFAPTDGLAIHATSADGGGWMRRQEPLDEGQTVRERQELIYLPTADRMMAEVQVHESNLSKVRPGLGVRLVVDALPEERFVGHITQIAPLPDAQSSFMNPDLKVYKTQIAIEGSHPNLRTGMTCQAEIMIDRFDSTLYVPVQSVFLVSGTPTAFVPRGNGDVEQRPVEVGLDNNRMIQILGGLAAGDRVMLAPPLEVAAASLDDEEAANAASEAEFVGAREAPAATAGPGADGSAPAGGQERAGGPPGGGGGGGFGDMSEEDRAKMRERFQNMSPEERETFFQERLKNMTPEEREAMEERRRNRGGGGGFGGGGGGRGGGGDRGERGGGDGGPSSGTPE